MGFPEVRTREPRMHIGEVAGLDTNFTSFHGAAEAKTKTESSPDRIIRGKRPASRTTRNAKPASEGSRISVRGQKGEVKLGVIK